MSVENNLVQVVQKQIDIYNRGKEDGRAEGIKTEYDRFWDSFQEFGNRTSYYSTFSEANGWTDDIYNPKYTVITPTRASTMYQRTAVTDTKVTLVLTYSAGFTYVFYNSKSIKIIRKIIVAETTTYFNWFNDCSALENITFEGEIGNDIDLHWSTLLTTQSLLSILTVLSKSTATAAGKTATFALASQSKINQNNACLTQYNAALLAGWTITFI